MRRLAIWNHHKSHDDFLPAETRVKDQRGESEAALEDQVLLIDHLQFRTHPTGGLRLRKTKKGKVIGRGIVGNRVTKMKDSLNMRKYMYYRKREYDEVGWAMKVYGDGFWDVLDEE